MGYKVFSINTTIRNPQRNRDFLIAFKPFSGQVFTADSAHAYLWELIKKGIYQVSDIPNEIRQKWENDIELTPSEIRQAIDDNPQATGLYGRTMTHLRSLRDQGFVQFSSAKRNNIITITRLGQEIIDNTKDPTIVYTKAMLGMHANSPVRPKILNRSRPFLNTLFVIEEVNRRWQELGNQPKGVLLHEFATFVLSMQNCDYQCAAENIIAYRQIFKSEINRAYIENFLRQEHIIPIAFNSLIKDYPDEVFRKFEMTGLLTKHGAYQYIYINFSQYNYAKVQTILQAYRDYRWETFDTVPAYYAFLEQQVVPWETDESVRRKVVSEKAKVLGVTLSERNSLEQNEEYLDRMFYTHALEKAVQKYDYSFITQELQILAGTRKVRSELESISEPLRLEYLLALFFGKKYGLQGLVSNIIYNEEGMPLHCATGGKSDIVFYHSDGSYILEPTMLSSKAQQQNSETSNIVRHVKDEESKTPFRYRVMMVAPRVHADIADYFQYKAEKEDANIIPITIERAVGLFKDSAMLQELNLNYDSLLHFLLQQSTQVYSDTINAYRINDELPTQAAVL